jgi:tRNA G10  N-methylase Trm11
MIKSYSPYVYLGINRVTNEFYIGARYSHCNHKRNSVDDLGTVYYTSSKVVKPMFAQFDWTILAHFATKEDALDYETQLISEHWNNPLLLNKNTGGKKFHRPDNYVKRPYRKKDRSATMKKLWQDPEFKEKQCTIRKQTHTTVEFKQAHSIAMKKVSKQSKQVCRVCRLSDRKEMTVQNFSRYS